MPENEEMITLLEQCMTSDGWLRGLKAILEQNAQHLQDQILHDEDPMLNNQTIITERERLRIKYKEITELIEAPEKFLGKLKQKPQEQEDTDDPYPQTSHD